MSDLPFTALDIIILAVCLLSGLFALLRGFTREVFTIITWIGAVFVGFYFLPYLGPTFRNYITIGAVADVFAFAIPFFIVFFALTHLCGRLSKLLGTTEIGPIDGTAGFFFGLVRGFIVVTIAYFSVDVFTQPEKTPDWMIKAKFRPMIEDTTDFYYSLVPNLKADKEEEARKKAAQKKAAQKKEQGYSDKDRDALNRLFDNAPDD